MLKNRVIQKNYDNLYENNINKGKKKNLEIYYNKGITLYIDFLQSNHQELMNYDFNNFFNFRLCDIKKLDKYGSKESKENDDLKLLDIKLGYFNQKDIKVEPKKPEPEVRHRPNELSP